MASILNNVHWLSSTHEYGGACIHIEDLVHIYIDPACLHDSRNLPKADFILITHPHSDHFDLDTMNVLRKSDTVFVFGHEWIHFLSEKPSFSHIHEIKRGESLTFNHLSITAIPAYSKVAHPKENGGLGYLIHCSLGTIYHSGDSSFIPEMTQLPPLDLACLDVRAPYQFSHQDVLAFVHATHPKNLYLLHWIDEEKNEITKLMSQIPSTTHVVY